MNDIERFQEQLLLIRRTVGWTAEEFGERVGLSRQSINNLEGRKVPLNKTVYIAMRSVLDGEIRQHPEDTEMLAQILNIFVDHPDRFTDEEKNEALAKANLMSPAILAKTASREAVSKEWKKAVLPILGAAALSIGAIVFGSWLSQNSMKKK